MKHLKKLSVVLMLTALFSVTFTSCIDNEVSPVVEAIYEAQADLIAAQAGVQNAEAALLLAKANAQQAVADATAATSAANSAASAEALRLAIATNDAAIATAQLNLDIAQKNWAVLMIGIQAQLDAAGATNAAGYLAKYITAIGAVNTDTNALLSKQGDLAKAELLLNTTNTATLQSFIDMQEDALAGKYAIIASNTAKIAAYEAALANPTAMESQIAGLEDQVDVLMDRKADLVAEIALAQQDVNEAQAAIDAATNFMSSPSGTYATAKASLDLWKGNYTADTTAVTTQSGLVAQYTTAIANYDGTTTTLTAAKNAAVAVIGQSTTLPYTGLKGDIKTLENTLGDYGVAPVYGDSPRTATAPAVLTAQDNLWNADLALLTFEQDFAALTASYNQAAIDLVTATNTYNTTDWVAENTAAASALTTAQGNLATDIAYYDAKKAIFEADPAGITWFDATSPLGTVTGTPDAYTNTFIGNHADAIATSYRQVLTWAELVSGSGNFYPATYATTSVATIPADVVGPPAIDYEEFTGTPLATATPTIIYYVETELDDVSETNVALFNAASTDLGVEVTAAFYTGTTIRDYTDVAPRNFVIEGIAGYYNPATATTYQALWNAQKFVSYKLYAQANAAALLAIAQEEYDYQKGLFETGLATRTTLEASVAAAEAVIGADSTPGPASGLLGQLEALNTQLGNTAFGTPIVTDVAKTTAGTLGSDYYMVGSVKTLTAYAVKWNAELALVKHLATTLSQYQTMLATAQTALTAATREAAEDLIFIAKYTADLAALQAEYDALILTPLYAALNVTLVEATQAKQLLVNESIAVDGMLEALLGDLYTSTAPTVPVAGNGLIADLKTSTSYTDWAGKITTAENAIAAAEAAIPAIEVALALAENDLDQAINVTIEKLKADIVKLEASIAANQALAVKWKALMDAALLAS